MPPVVLMILGGIQAAIQEFPQIMTIVQRGKDFFSGLVDDGVITIEQQKQLNDRLDHLSESAQNGEIPRGWTVDPDPEEE